MLNTSEILRGFTDALILSQLSHHDSYGYELNKSISNRSGGTFEFKEATLYTSFRRLEENGFITSYWGDENSGARRRYYSITENGRVANQENRKDWNVLKGLMDSLLDTTEKLCLSENTEKTES